MNQLHIAPESLGTAASGMESLATFAELGTMSADMATINRNYSRASGFDQLGSIHGSSLNTHPGSAAAVLKALALELAQIIENLGATRTVVATQDLAASLAFSLADMGGAVEKTTEAFAARAASGAAPLHKEPVIVLPDFSIGKLVNDLNTTNSGAAVTSQSIWGELASRTSDIAGGMIELSSYIGAENLGLTADAISARLQEVAGRSRTISANSNIFQSNLGALEATRGTRAAEVAVAQAEIEALRSLGPQGAAAAQIAEQMFLQYYAVSTQAALTGLIPPVINLTSPEQGNPGGTATAGMETVDGTGSRYTTAGVVTPHRIADSVLDFVRANPESFDRINHVTRDMATSAGADLGEGLFSPQGINTAAASAGTSFAPPGALAGTGPLAGHGALGGSVPTGAPAGGGVSGGLGGLSPGLAAVPGLGRAGTTAAPASVSPSNLSHPAARLAGAANQIGGPLPGNGPGPTNGVAHSLAAVPGALRAGSPVTSLDGTAPVGTRSRTTLGSPLGTTAGGGLSGATTGGPVGATTGGPVGGTTTGGPVGATTTGGGVGAATGLRSAHGVNNSFTDEQSGRRFSGGAGAGTSIGARSGPGISTGHAGSATSGHAGSTVVGHPGSAAAGDADSTRRGAGAIGGGFSAPHGSAAGAGSSHSGSRDAAPMMGHGGRGTGDNRSKRAGKVRSVISSVEQDGNMRELLGERPEVVPGVIGDWARGSENR